MQVFSLPTKLHLYQLIQMNESELLGCEERAQVGNEGQPLMVKQLNGNLFFS